jgi:hypothetical protein
MLAKIHFLTFGAGDTWPEAARRLGDQARSTGMFSTVSVEIGDEIFLRWPEFKQHREFVEKNPRGWGYWLWKPFLIRSYFRSLKEGDILLYLDAGFELVNYRRLPRVFREMAERGAFILSLSEYPILNAIFWTKQDLLDKFSREFSLTDTLKIPTFAAGCSAYVKNAANTGFLEDWYRIASSDGYRYIDDTPSQAPQKTQYFENRHDQSVFNLLLDAYRIEPAGQYLDYNCGAHEFENWPALLQQPFLRLGNRKYETVIPPRRRPSLLDEIKSRLCAKRRHPMHLQRNHPWVEEMSEPYTDLLVSLGLLSRGAINGRIPSAR